MSCQQGSEEGARGLVVLVEEGNILYSEVWFVSVMVVESESLVGGS